MKKFSWTVVIEVDETLVADGFDLTDDRAQDMIQRALPHAYGYEVSARVIKAPKKEDIIRAKS